MLITLDGPEGSGKSTVSKVLKEMLSKIITNEIIISREPGGTVVGEKIRDILITENISSKTELFLFMASRIEHIEKVIKPALNDNKIVILDRFYNSSLAIQGEARGLGIDIVREKHKYIIEEEGLKVDLEFFLDIDPKKGLDRKSENEINKFELEEIDFHHSIYNGYKKILSKGNLIRIDANEDIETIATNIFFYILDELNGNFNCKIN